MKVGNQEIPGEVDKFGLGVQNEADKFGLGVQNEAEQRLTECCQENTLVIANTIF